MFVDDALDGRQADACAREIRYSMQTLESPKEFVGVGHVKSRSVVPNEIGPLTIFVGNSKLYFRLGLLEDYGDQLDEQGKDFLERSRAASQLVPVVISDEETSRLASVFLTLGWGVTGAIAAPIFIRSEVYGILTVVFDHHRRFAEEDINLLQSLADSAAVAITNAQFIDQTQRAREEAEDANKELDAFNYSVRIRCC